MKIIALASIALSSLTTVSAIQQTTCTFRGIKSEDHWEAKRAYPFGVCDDNSGDEKYSYILPKFKNDMSTWSEGDVFQLELEPLHKPAAMNQRVASWQSGAKDAWVVTHSTVVSRKANRRKLMYNSKQARSLLSIRLKYTDANTDYCDEACVTEGMNRVEATTAVSSYGILTWTQKKVITVNMGGGISPLRGCEWYQIDAESDRADAAARNQFSIEPTNFDHVEYWLPTEAQCTWGGLGELSDRRTWEVADGASYPGIRLHEFGHNFGLHHAGSADWYDGMWNTCEYCDNSGPMGGAELVGNILPHMYGLAWILDSHVAKLHSAGVKNSRALTIRATSYDPRTASNGDYAGAYLTVKEPGYSPKLALWASLRTARGVDSALWWDDKDKVFIHLGYLPYADGSANPELAYRLARLAAGDHFVLPTTDPSWGDNAAVTWDGECGNCAHVIKVCSLDVASGVAKVTIGASADGASAALTKANGACSGTLPPSSSPPPSTSTPPSIAPPAVAPSPPPSSGGELCTNTCRYKNDGDCDDGGLNSDYSFCLLGTDCNDCGPRDGDSGTTPPPSLAPSPSPPPTSPKPPPPSPPPSPAGGVIPAGGVQVMYGNSDRMLFCLKPGMESVKRVSDLADPPVHTLSRPVIAAQCCTARNQCRRRPGNVCIAGFSGRPSGGGFAEDPWITAMTYGEAKAKCASKGLQMCKKSCAGTGCWYNAHPVYTDKPCPSVAPPPPAASSPPPAPSTPPSVSPPPPHVEYSDWVPMSTLTKAASEAEAAYLQRCLRECEAKGSECVGFVDEPACTTGSAGSRCCKLHDALTRFYTPSASTYIKRGSGTLVPASAGRSAPSMANSNPDWTYDNAGDDDDVSDGESEDGKDDHDKAAGGSSSGDDKAGKDVDGGRPHPTHQPSPLDELDEVSGDTTDKEEEASSGVLQEARIGGRLASALGDGALIGVAVAIVLSGIVIGIFTTLGAQRCQHRAGGSEVTATNVKTHVDDASAEVSGRVMSDFV